MIKLALRCVFSLGISLAVVGGLLGIWDARAILGTTLAVFLMSFLRVRMFRNSN